MQLPGHGSYCQNAAQQYHENQQHPDTGYFLLGDFIPCVCFTHDLSYSMVWSLRKILEGALPSDYHNLCLNYDLLAEPADCAGAVVPLGSAIILVGSILLTNMSSAR